MAVYNQNESPLQIKSHTFAVQIVKYIKGVDIDWRIKPLYDQILRSGTSIAANIHESEFAQSPADFISKLSIALKEANETLYWIRLLTDSECISTEQSDVYQRDCRELISMLVASIKTAKNRLGIVQ